MSGPTSQRAIAEALGVSLSSLQEAIATGRVDLTPPVDLEVVRAAWLASSQATGPDSMINRTDDEPSAAAGKETRAEALRRNAIAQADLRELELKKRLREVVDAKAFEQELGDLFVNIKTRLLAIPSRCKQILPQLTNEDVGAIEDLVREALEELADDKR